MRKQTTRLIVMFTLASLIFVVGYGYTQRGVNPQAQPAGCCAVASAYASTDDARLNVIREFRDSYLLTNPLGRGVAALYYNVFSPPVAHFIQAHPAIKPVARAFLMPVVALSTFAINTTLVDKVATLGFLTIASVFVVLLLRMRRSKRSGHF
jgi:hypothetical protein